MCGIAGIIAFNEAGKKKLDKIASVAGLLKHRGPDNQQHCVFEKAAFAHARLSIIDTSAASNQPFMDKNNRYVIVFNGELFNYEELKNELTAKGYSFSTSGDVEVLLNLYIEEKEKCLDRIKGFYAFSVYDLQEEKLFMARDRFGVKPLYYALTNDVLCWSSELRPLQYITGINTINRVSLFTYLQLNYLPGYESMLQNIRRLEPGTYLQLNNNEIQVKKHYSLQLPVQVATTKSPEEKIKELLTESVKLRLVSDVPVGSFLSGGIDSTIITGIAAQLSPSINTFSLGFKDNVYFDETKYAEIAAKTHKTHHHTFQLSNNDLLSELHNFLEAIDEPFADSSALNVYILSKLTKQHVKVVLSGDGADEIFAGYNKHRAEWMIQNRKGFNRMVALLAPLLKIIPQSRSSALFNKFRQLQRYQAGLKSTVKERYWKWASISSEEETQQLLKMNGEEYKTFGQFKQNLLQALDDDFNSFLLTDMQVILPYDMLTKADMMSMAHGLEIRNPFLDHRLVEYAFSLQPSFKINAQEQKLILKKAFKHLLPDELIHRKKHGFEVPLQHWFQNELRADIENKWLNHQFIVEQGIFHPDEIKNIKQQLFSSSPGDAAARVWALIVFNSWWKKHIYKS